MIAIRLLKLKLELNNAKTEMNCNIFSSCYFSCNLFQTRLTEKKFRPFSVSLSLFLVPIMYFVYDVYNNNNLHYFVLKFRCSTTISPTEV